MSSTIEQLLKIQSEALKDGEYFLSIYLPGKDGDEIYFKRELRAAILSSMKTRKELNNCKRVSKALIEKINKIIHRISNYQSGLAIFAKFNCEGLHVTEPFELNDKNVLVKTLSIEPKRQIIIGKVLVLNQLVRIENLGFNSLLIKLNQDWAKLYFVNQNEIILIRQEPNNYITDKERQTSQIYKVKSTGTTIQRQNTNKFEKDNLSRIRGFLNYLNELIKINFQKEITFDYVVVNYGESFNELIESFLKNLNKTFSKKIRILTIKKTINTETELKKEVKKTILRFKRNELLEIWQKSKNNFNNYIEKLTKIVEAVNLKRIKTLFVKDEMRYKGYIKDNLLSLSKREGYQITLNLIPRLIIKTLESGAEVKVFKSNRMMPDISAQLRF